MNSIQVSHAKRLENSCHKRKAFQGIIPIDIIRSNSQCPLGGCLIAKPTQTVLIVYVTLFLVGLYNYSFIANTLRVYPPEADNIGFLISLTILLLSFIALLLTLVSSRFTIKPVVIAVLMLSSLTAYFMDTYRVIIDNGMIHNILQTNLTEAMDLLTVKLVAYFLLLGVLPSLLVYKTPIYRRGIKDELFAKLKLIILSLLLMTGSVFLFSKHYTSFLREHKPLRYYINPTSWIYAIGKHLNETFSNASTTIKPMGTDAKVITKNNGKTLAIMVVGEAVRADHFSLNGYIKTTNPLLEQEEIVNFSNTYACGTSTADSVPCMFSHLNRANYSHNQAKSTHNVLDILSHTQAVKVLWRDNNSDSKGVALRVDYEDYKTSENNTICTEGECRDVGMLAGLDTFIKKHAEKSILIVLHQMGNHGPAYYKRYPKAYRKFTPTCDTNQLEQCSNDEISNTYDNALLYTDYFLAQTIALLKKYNSSHKTAMIYMSDHGESLGENGLYLHGLPYFMAPDAQTHIGSVMWFGQKIRDQIDTEALKKNSAAPYSHDNLFHTLLGIFDVKTELYESDKDILYLYRKDK